MNDGENSRLTLSIFRKASILLQHQTVSAACCQRSWIAVYCARETASWTSPRTDADPTITVQTRCPHTAVLLQHHVVCWGIQALTRPILRTSKRFSNVLSPSWPYRFRPVVQTLPSFISATLWVMSASKATALPDMTWSNLKLSVLDPSSSWPNQWPHTLSSCFNAILWSTPT